MQLLQLQLLVMLLPIGTSRVLVVNLIILLLLLIFIQDATGVEDSNSGGSGQRSEDISSMSSNSSCGTNINYSDCSFQHELANLRSNDLINITADVMLLSIISLVGIENISIIGHNNPTVNCDNVGGMFFDNCHNCTIIGITWEKCGKNDSIPAIEMYNSSNIIIENCSFQHSVTQVIALSEMLGTVTINRCKFIFNQFEGHGTAIYYLSKITLYSEFQFTIANCNFTHNRASIDKSVVYISPSNNISMEQVHLTNSVFLSNQGSAIYISHHNIFASGIILFEGNEANSGGGIFITNHSNIVFQNSDVKFASNQALNDGGALFIENSNITFKGSSIVTAISNQALRFGGAFYIGDNSDVTFEANCTVVVNNTQARHGGAIFIINNSDVKFAGYSTVTFNKNLATGYGGGVFTYDNSRVTFEGDSTLTITNNQATRGGGFLIWVSNVEFAGNSTLTFSNNQATRGGALFIWDRCDVTFIGNSKVNINNNQGTYGGAVFVGVNSGVTFEGNPTVTLNNNQAIKDGGAFYIWNNCYVTFEGNSIVTVTNNQAQEDGGSLHISATSDITFDGNSTVNISYNQAVDTGGALYNLDNSHVVFKGDCTVTINNNKATQAGAFFVQFESIVRIEGNSTVTINNNQGTENGGAFLIWDNGDVTFKGSSTVTINNNHATLDGGAFYITFHSVTFEENCRVTINNNQATRNGGALYIDNNSGFTVKGNSVVTINNNQATYGGALYVFQNCSVILKGSSTVNFYNNPATASGGALYFIQKCSVSFEEDSFVVFYSNTANADGGALYAQDHCNVRIKGNSTAIFNNNEALSDGGALYTSIDSDIFFQASTTVQFNDNKATYFGGALRSKYNSNIVFQNNCKIIFNHNEASQGGAIFTASDIVFNENSTVQFDNNKATFGGALHISNLKFQGNTAVRFKNNEAELNGGALYSDNSSIAVKHISTITFTNNKAENGGAIFATTSTLLVSEYSNVTFYRNTADRDGGAIYFHNQIIASFKNSSTVTMISNAANNSGGAIYSEITPNTKYFNISEIHNIGDNTATVAGSLLYIDVSESCNSSCLNARMLGISNGTLYHDLPDKRVSTSPGRLKLYHPAKCISNDSVTCEKYYIENIMLGQEITINPCLLDYYNSPAKVTQFRIAGDENQNYFVQGSEYTSISCDHTIEGIIVTGNIINSSLPFNYSVLFTSNTTFKSERKIISVNLTVELIPCHPGFQYHTKSQKCKCYNTSGMISCSGSSSAIRRGYWFGHVTGIPTVTFCPINYCNFTCCKTTNEYYHLSPVRDNQCKSHRSGTACGRCEEGYTLSFDSAECIDVNKCNIGLIILVVMLTVLYWLIVVVAVFIITYYKVSIGYFYAVTYYYSVVDIMLSQHTDISNGLYIAVTIVSSTAKVTPQFLGHLCLFKNMSGIDQQFIHYIHPLAVSVILIMISWLARHSKKLLMFISRRIIHAICFLMLLSYTLVTTTSLLLMRSLTFVDVDNVYTYLSPEIKYFHGRHLAYGIIAIILALVIVIGLPLLLILEPFLNNKINFFRIKPLLDQFQGCYKDKYRWCAAYYMICRLIIIIIANFSEEFVSRYLLITANTAIALIHVTVEPYANDILNKFDGAILHLMVLVTALPLFEYFDTFDSGFVVGIAFVLVILPLILFVVMKAFASKHTLREISKNAIKHCSFQSKVHKNEPATVASKPSLTNGFDLIVDDNMRRGCTTVIEM